MASTMFIINNLRKLLRKPGFIENSELARIIAAGVVSPKFAKGLLNNPVETIEKGYQGEKFILNADDLEILTKAASSSETLPELAKKLEGLEEKPRLRG